MSVTESVRSSIKEAMRAKDKPRLGTLRLISSEFKRIEVDERIEVDDDRALIVLDKMCKQRRDSEQQFLDAGRAELAEQENARVAILSLDDQPIAWQVELLSSGNLGIHHLAFDQRWKKYSPGKQLLHHQISLAWKEGRTIDFLPGNFEYKEKISTRVESVHEFHWFKRSIRGFLAKKLILGNIKVRRKIRQKSGKTKVSKTMKEILEEKNG